MAGLKLLICPQETEKIKTTIYQRKRNNKSWAWEAEVEGSQIQSLLSLQGKSRLAWANW